MVVFTCNHCGDSLQKPKAEKHYETKCRNNYPNLCCVDCLKDFHGDEFRAHTKCVTEAERYGGKGYVAKPNQNKGEVKQNAWIEIVQSVLNENKKLSGTLRYLLEKISNQPNTPRKKPKFLNFVRSMERKATTKDIEAAWELLSSKLDKLTAVYAASKNIPPQKKDETKHNNSVATVNGTSQGQSDANKKDNVINEKKNKKKDIVNNDNNDESKENKNKKKKAQNDKEIINGQDSCKEEKNKKLKTILKPKTGSDKVESRKELKAKKKHVKYQEEVSVIEENGNMKKSQKRKLEEPSNDETSESTSKKVKKNDMNDFDWKTSIISVLGKKDKDVTMKKLQKRVFAQYCIEHNTNEVTDRMIKKFTKSLYKIPHIKVDNCKVFLTTKTSE